MRYLRACLIVAILLAVACSAAEARVRRAPTIREYITDADAIVYGRLENARQKGDDGETDLVIVSVIKSHPQIEKQKKLVIPRFVKDFDPKQHFLVLVNSYKGKLDIYGGIPADTAMVEYAKRILKLDSEKPVETLRFYFDFLHDKDEKIREDALLEFSSAPEPVVGKVGRKLPAESLRAWLRDSKAAKAHGRYAHLLSYCGEPKDADDLFKLLESNTKKLDLDLSGGRFGITLAPLCLNPETYVPKLRAIAKDPKAPFLSRYAILNAAAHVHEHRSDLHKRVDAIAMIKDFLDVPDMADFAIERLRTFKRWELTDRILGIFDKKDLDSPIIRKSILRFALQAPGPAAAEFVARMRKKDAEWVEETKELFELELMDKAPSK